MKGGWGFFSPYLKTHSLQVRSGPHAQRETAINGWGKGLTGVLVGSGSAWGESPHVSAKAGIFSGDRFGVVSLSGHEKSYIFFPRIIVLFSLPWRRGTIETALLQPGRLLQSEPAGLTLESLISVNQGVLSSRTQPVPAELPALSAGGKHCVQTAGQCFQKRKTSQGETLHP